MSELEEAVARLERAIARLEAGVDPARRAAAERATKGATAIAERVEAALARLAQLLEEDA